MGLGVLAVASPSRMRDVQQKWSIERVARRKEDSLNSHKKPMKWGLGDASGKRVFGRSMPLARSLWNASANATP